MAISTLPTAPARTNSPAVFVTRADALVAALPAFVSEANALAASMTGAAAGGALTIPYTFSTLTADSDPGSGFLRLNNSVQNISTVLRLDLTGADNKTWTGVIDTFDDSTSATKGQLKITKITDITKWILFDVSAVAVQTGYRNVTGAVALSSDPNPFLNGDSLVISFSRTGDKGTIASNTEFTPVAVAAANVDCSLGNYFYKTISTATTFAFSNIPVGGFSFTLEVQMDAGGSIVLPASVTIARDQMPTLSTGKTHLFMFSTRNGGTRWRMTIGDNYTN